jgi:2-methylcitrate dehydratase PrpD
LNRMLAEPLEQKRCPATAIDAKFSLPFTVAVAVQRGEVRLDDFLPVALQDRAILALAAKVHYTARQEQASVGSEALRGQVRFHTRDGGHRELELDEPLGSERRPLTDDALVAKFIDCCLRASSPPSRQRALRWAEEILTLEARADVGAWVRALGHEGAH